MRSRNVLMVSALTATLLAGLWLKPKQPRAEAEATMSKPMVKPALVAGDLQDLVSVTITVLCSSKIMAVLGSRLELVDLLIRRHF